MSKFVCLNAKCGAVFDDDEIVRAVIDRHPYGEGTTPEYGCVCPKCRKAEIALAIQCESCGKWIPEDEAERHPITEDVICYDCLDNIRAFGDYLRDEAIDDRVLHTG